MEDTIIKALLLGYAHIECCGTPIRICLAQDDEDHVVLVLRFQLRRDRNAADRHAGRKLILDPKAVFFGCSRPMLPAPAA